MNLATESHPHLAFVIPISPCHSERERRISRARYRDPSLTLRMTRQWVSLVIITNRGFCMCETLDMGHCLMIAHEQDIRPIDESTTSSDAQLPVYGLSGNVFHRTASIHVESA